MDLEYLQQITDNSDNIPINDLRGFIKYLCLRHEVDHLDTIPLVHTLSLKLNRKKTAEYGFFAYT